MVGEVKDGRLSLPHQPDAFVLEGGAAASGRVRMAGTVQAGTDTLRVRTIAKQDKASGYAGMYFAADRASAGAAASWNAIRTSELSGITLVIALEHEDPNEILRRIRPALCAERSAVTKGPRRKHAGSAGILDGSSTTEKPSPHGIPGRALRSPVACESSLSRSPVGGSVSR